ncbi:MAG TPA: PfkB family carbohydrate kinase [Bryobacteraceae bacterium]|nr:PfkB family carbohydrate kinase [Bryobacteraceae bacterium]
MNAREILHGLGQMSALVVGDICLDRWCTYDPALSQPSRETGIPRTAVTSTVVTAGAGGTVANNLVALGTGRVTILGAVGDDGSGMELLRALARNRISVELTVKAPNFNTFTYTKLINARTGMEDLPRVDFVYNAPLPADVEAQLIHSLDSFVNAFDVILVSDQAETETCGVVTPLMRQCLQKLAAGHPEKVIWVDSRMRPEHFRGVIVKPNRDEAEQACLRRFGRVDLGLLHQEIGGEFLLVTEGQDGVAVVNSAGETRVPTRPVAAPVDICGAGDSFSAGAALAYAITRSPVDAARFGNIVASITIMKKGTGTASPEEVLAAEASWPV